MDFSKAINPVLKVIKQQFVYIKAKRSGKSDINDGKWYAAVYSTCLRA